MGLDIRSLAATAFSIGQQLADQAFESVTVRFDPAVTPDPVNNTTATVWGHEFSAVQALGYDDADERRDRGSSKTVKVWLLDRADILAAATESPSVITQGGQIEDAAGTIWEAYRAEFDPSRSAVMLYCEA